MNDTSHFSEIPLREWNEMAARAYGANVFMGSEWEAALSRALPFVGFRHYRYRDTHLVRVADIAGRLTSAPFAEGSDVLSLGDGVLSIEQLESDAAEHFGHVPRLRVNERFALFSDTEEEKVAADEYVLELGEPILPRVRKTVRHILSREIEGAIEQAEMRADIDAAYQLYLRHMRSVRNFAIPRALFSSLIRVHGGELWVWRSDGVVGAAALFLPGTEEVLYSLSAADRTALTANAPHHLVYAALEEYRNRGLMRASLGATGKGSPLEVFKRGWRGEQYRILELGKRAGVSRTSRTRELAGLVPLRFYPLLTSIAGRYLL